jgi:hypothetical protein
MLLGFLGLGIDMGYMRYMKRKVQMAADAAAMAGANEIGKTDVANAAETAVSTDNSFPSVSQSTGCTATPGTLATVVLVNNPPTCISTDPHNGNSSYVEVYVFRNVPTFFAKVFTPNVTVSARAEAGIADSPDCMYVLAKTLTQALSLVGAGTINTPGCGIFVESSDPEALYLKETSTSITAASVNVVGGCYEGGQGKSDTKCSTVTPNPNTGVAAPSPTDPLASQLTPPTYTACTSVGSATTEGSNANVTLMPGNYCGGISITNNAIVTFSPGNYVVGKGISIVGDATVTFGAGTYVIEGGGISFGNGTTSTGSGVMFFLTGSSANSAFNYGPVSVVGGATVTLSAPTSGTYNGILFYQDPNAYGATPSTTSNASSFTNGANSELNGALYFPTTGLTYSGGSVSSTQYTVIVAYSISVSGSAVLNDNWPDGDPVKTPGNAVLGE